MSDNIQHVWLEDYSGRRRLYPFPVDIAADSQITYKDKTYRVTERDAEDGRLIYVEDTAREGA